MYCKDQDLSSAPCVITPMGISSNKTVKLLDGKAGENGKDGKSWSVPAAVGGPGQGGKNGKTGGVELPRHRSRSVSGVWCSGRFENVILRLDRSHL